MREREIDNLQNLIYGYSIEDQETEAESDVLDCNRYDVNRNKLEQYLRPEYKKLLKSKFLFKNSQTKNSNFKTVNLNSQIFLKFNIF